MPQPIDPREITPPGLYARRREFIRSGALFVASGAALGTGLTVLSELGSADPPVKPPPLPKPAPGAAAWDVKKPGRYSVPEAQTPYEDVTTYNNYYELGLSKSDPARLGFRIKTRPWALRITGELKTPLTLDVDTLIRWFGLEERVYRMRCVEAWSMVIPWLGFPLAELVARAEPTSRAKYVTFTTLQDAEQLPNQDSRVLAWPYTEGLRIDEAMHPLAFIALGLYGAPLPGQNGAPLRLVVPWKYGFKGAESLVEMRFVEHEPETAWNRAAPDEYGFFANVNPLVDHPRWSQATERRIGELERRKTLPFNGYQDAVADLYRGMDLRRYFVVAPRRLGWLGPATIAGSLVPFASLAGRAYRHQLGANPVATALNQLGLLALLFLVASLSCTPLKIAFGWTWPVRIRRTLGLFAFFTVCLHFLVYFGLDQAWSWRSFFEDFRKRTFIGLGVTALLLLVPLALTSTKRSVTRLGFRVWQRLHQLVYLIGVLAVLHFYVRVKADHTQPLLYASVLGLGFGLRLVAAWQTAQNARRRTLARH